MLIVTRRNADASRLNAMVRDLLRAEGRLAPTDVALPSINREKKAATLSLAAGDRVRFGDTLPDLGIRNGTRGTVEAIEATLRVRLDDGRVVEQPWQAFARLSNGVER